jgi:hypothetical protein
MNIILEHVGVLVDSVIVNDPAVVVNGTIVVVLYITPGHVFVPFSVT